MTTARSATDHILRRLVCFVLVLGASALMTACGGGGGDDVAGTPNDGPFTIGGTVAGLAGSGLVLQNNGGDDLAVTANGSFTFATRLAPGMTYHVTVLRQPAGQRCQVELGSGTVGTTITAVRVLCGAISVAVLPLYPNQGVDWNDYLADDGADRLSAGDQACGSGRCLHGGEMRVWRAPQIASCAGLAVADALGAFDWVCDDRGGSTAFVSVGLKDGKRLSDLIDFDTLSWRDNQVLVTGAATLSSPAGKWWARPIEAANAGGDLFNPRVYVVTATTRASYAMVGDKVALVVRPGVVVQGTGTTEAVIDTTFRRYLWLEAAADALGATYAVHFQQAEHSVIRGVDVTHAQTGLAVNWAHDNRFSDIRAYANSGDGVNVGARGGSARNLFTNLTTTRNGIHGISIGGSTVSRGNVLRRILTANNIGDGVRLLQQSDTRFEDVTASANGDYGVFVNPVPASTSLWMVGVTATNNRLDGIVVQGNDATLHHAAAVNNGGYGIFLAGDNLAAVDLLAVGNLNAGVRLNFPSSAYFGGWLKVGGNAGGDCSVGAGSIGLLGDCSNAGSSDTTAVKGVSATTSFVGKVLVDDPANASDNSGAAAFVAITDWLGFARSRRAWGMDGLAFPDPTHRGACTSETCRIWDWNLASGDGVLRNAVALPSGNDVLVLRRPAADAAACALLPGATWDAANSRCISTTLRHAVEIAGDGVGNDNALCESGERCLYGPNLGSYQGHGALVSAGSFAGGVLSGITLLRHATNGY